MDMLARELKMDPAEVRRKNFIPKDKFPFQTQMGAVYDSGDYEKALDARAEGCELGRVASGARCGPQGGPSRRARPGDVRRGLRHRTVGRRCRPAGGSTRR